MYFFYLSYCPVPVLKIEDTIIPLTHSHKYLGLLLTSNLSWSEHIDNICAKARRMVGLLYRRFYRDVDSDSLLRLYLAFVRPHTEYASQVWNPHAQKNIKQLERIYTEVCFAHVCQTLGHGI